MSGVFSHKDGMGGLIEFDTECDERFGPGALCVEAIDAHVEQVEGGYSVIVALDADAIRRLVKALAAHLATAAQAVAS